MSPTEYVTSRFHLGKRRPLKTRRASRTFPAAVRIELLPALLVLGEPGALVEETTPNSQREVGAFVMVPLGEPAPGILGERFARLDGVVQGGGRLGGRRLLTPGRARGQEAHGQRPRNQARLNNHRKTFWSSWGVRVFSQRERGADPRAFCGFSPQKTLMLAAQRPNWDWAFLYSFTVVVTKMT